MNRQLLTDRSVERLKKPQPGERYEVYDERLMGFLCRVTCGARTSRVKKTLLLRARYPNSAHLQNKFRRETSGDRLNPVKREIGEFGKMTVDTARLVAQEWCLLISRGIDPKEEQQRQRHEAGLQRDATFQKVFERWLREHVAGKRRARRMENDTRQHLLPVFGQRPIKTITRGEIRDLVLRIKTERSRWTARGVLSLAKSIFGFAVQTDSYGLENSPAMAIKPEILGVFMSRSRVLDDTELVAVWKATDSMDSLWSAFFKLSLLLGQRRSATAGMAKSETDFRAKTWSLSGDRTKMGKPFVLPLPPLAFSIIQERSAQVENDYLFSRDGKLPINQFSRAFKQLKIATAKLMDRPINELTFTLHDFRRSFRTNLTKHRLCDLDTAERCISHIRKTGLLATYDVYDRLPEMLNALTKYERFILNLVHPAPVRKVLPMHRRG